MNEIKNMTPDNQEMVQANTNNYTAEEYLALRKLLPETAQAFGVHGDEGGNIIFPYYENMEAYEKGDAVFRKLRPARKLDRSEIAELSKTEGKRSLFGMHLCDPEKGVLYIFADEFECMAGYQAHGGNCVAVPREDKDFDWNRNCSEFISKFRRAAVILPKNSSDQKLALEISRKLEIPVDIPDLKLYGKNKSISSVLYNEGIEKVSDIMNSAKPEPIPGLINITKISLVSIRDIPRVLTGIPSLDYVTGGFRFGGVDVWTGKTGEGKSTFLSQMLLEAIEQGYKVFAYSGELPKEDVKNCIYAQAAGEKYVQTFKHPKTGKIEGEAIPEAAERIDQWLDGRLWLYDKDFKGANEAENLLKVVESAYRANDCRVFLLDNLMTVNTYQKGRDSYEVEADFVNSLCQMASRLGILIHLIIHPRKTDGRPVMSNDDVGGSSRNTNLASAVFSVRRVAENDQKKEGQNAAFTCMKGRNGETKGSIPLEFHPYSRRFVSINAPEKQYSWDTTGLSMEPSEQMTLEADELPF